MTDTVQVPREATAAMLQAVLTMNRSTIAPLRPLPIGYEMGWAARIWAAMVAAAPQATDPRDAEIERLTRERDACERQYQERVAEIGAEMSRTAAAQAENEKLREAVHAAKQLIDNICEFGIADGEFVDAAHDAIAALPRSHRRSRDGTS
jgi:hypothetical protein